MLRMNIVGARRVSLRGVSGFGIFYTLYLACAIFSARQRQHGAQLRHLRFSLNYVYRDVGKTFQPAIVGQESIATVGDRCGEVDGIGCFEAVSRPDFCRQIEYSAS